jgi:hypothetical protein
MSTAAPPHEVLALAEEAYALVQARPRQALTLAERALAAARAERDGEAEVAALNALAWAQHVLGDKRALPTARAGIRVAERNGDRRGVGLLRRRLALTLAFAGKTRAAQRELDAALPLLSGIERAESEVHRIGLHFAAHSSDPEKHRQLCADVAAALRVLRREQDTIWEARLLFNRSWLFISRGELGRAEADIRRAHELYTSLGAEAAALDAAVVIALLALYRGDLLGCLGDLAEIDATLRPGHLSYNLNECRANALVQARLLPEARAAFEAYADLCSRTGRGDYVPSAMLSLSAIAMMARDAPTARQFATKAARSFAARHKPANAALARTACLRAQLVEGSLRPSSLRAGLDAAAVLELAGWRRDALRTRLVVARVALALGARRTARRQLELARPIGSRGTVADRTELCLTRALLRVSEGDRAGAERLLAGGLRALEDYRAALGAVELRATASGIGTELSEQGLRIALESHDPRKILVWAERLRGNALRLPLVRPPADPQLRSLQADLRRTAARLRDAEESGKPARDVAAGQARLEAAIRNRMRLVEGDGSGHSAIPGPRDSAPALGGRALVEYVQLDGALGGLTLVNGRLAFQELGPDTAASELEWLRFALARLARGADAPQRAAARDNAEASATALDRLLVEPLLPAIGDAELVLVPTGALHALPWGALPSLRGRPLSIAPSLSVWLELAARSRSRRRKTALVAGPRLRHSTAEVRELASLLPDSTLLQGDAATATAALSALDGAALAHLACHGRFRSDSPLFSSLELADGPLNVYELQSLKRAPDVVVLSACDLALSDRHPGDELLGLAAALLGMGTRTIVASVVPVPDAAARRLMVAFHRSLAGGDTPAVALAKAQARAPVPGFLCLGNG